MLEFRSLCVGYGSFPVLREVSLEVRRAEIVALLGSNGAGKTTATRAAAALLRPSSGEVRFLGEAVHKLGGHGIVERGLSAVAEERFLFPDMTVRENLELGAYARRARKRAKSTLEWIFGLFPVLRQRSGQRVQTLSGGEQQMVAVGRALMARPELLILDEPSAGLAPLIVAELFRVLREVNREGTAILLVEQNALESLRLAHRGYVLEEGRIVGEGTGAALLEDPRVRAAYLGV